MSREQKKWLLATIVLVVLSVSFGWYFTVARAIKASFQESRQQISGQLQETHQVFFGDGKIAKQWDVTKGKFIQGIDIIRRQLTNAKEQEQPSQK